MASSIKHGTGNSNPKLTCNVSVCYFCVRISNWGRTTISEVRVNIAGFVLTYPIQGVTWGLVKQNQQEGRFKLRILKPPKSFVTYFSGKLILWCWYFYLWSVNGGKDISIVAKIFKRLQKNEEVSQFERI